jgi:Cu/Ag efflux pump CusA
MLKVTEVLVTARRTGRAELDEHAEPPSNSEIEVALKDPEEILADLRNQLSVLKAVTVNIGKPISYRLNHLLSGVRAQITINLISKI